MCSVSVTPPCVPLPLPDQQLKDLVRKTRDWAILHGASMRSKRNFSEDSIQFAPFNLFPSTFLKKDFQKVVDVQATFQELIHKVAHDGEFLRKCLENTIQVDEFTGNLFKIYETVQKEGIVQTTVAPVNLIITLMIFKHDSSDGSTKLLRRFETDEHFNIADHYYNLHAVIVHFVSGVESGHYYALVKDETDWFKFDDSRLTKYSGNILIFLEPLETPYILFFEREAIGRSRSSDDVVLQVFQWQMRHFQYSYQFVA